MLDTAERIKQITIKNVLFLSFRNIGIQAISIVGFFLLTILLGTGEVGLFAIVSESIGILGYFSDFGLASAIIQKKDPPLDSELKTTFTIQQGIVLLGLITSALIFSQISSLKGYGTKELTIFYALCFSFFAASLKTIPSILLERKLNFKLISTVDIIENIIFYSLAVIFALLGFGAYSYAIAVTVRSLAGLFLIYYYSPWPLGFCFSLPVAKSLFKYGIPFQLNSFIAVAKDRLSSLLVAGIIGRESFGIYSWGLKATRLPLGFMDAIMKVTFPTFSRIQDNAQLLKSSLIRSAHLMALLVFPLVSGICLIAPDLIYLIPKYTKWAPALIPLYFLSLNAAIAAITTPLTNVFNATGQIRKTTRYMIMWTVLTWIFYPTLSHFFGYNGTAVAALIVGVSSFVVWLDINRTFNVNIFQAITRPLVSSLLMIFGVYLVSFLPLPLLSQLFLKIIIGTGIYLLSEYILDLTVIKWLIHNSKWAVSNS